MPYGDDGLNSNGSFKNYGFSFSISQEVCHSFFFQPPLPEETLQQILESEMQSSVNTDYVNTVITFP